MNSKLQIQSVIANIYSGGEKNNNKKLRLHIVVDAPENVIQAPKCQKLDNVTLKKICSHNFNFEA